MGMYDSIPPPKPYKNWLEVYAAVTKDGQPDPGISFQFPYRVIHEHTDEFKYETYSYKEICMYAMAYVWENLPTRDEMKGLIHVINERTVEMAQYYSLDKLIAIAKR